MVGFYTTTSRSVEPGEEALAFGLGRRRYPIPAVLIAQVGVTRAVQGHGIGATLLVDALARILGVADNVGFEMVLVDALNLEACAFYRKMQFESLEDNPLRLFMTIKKLRKTFDLSAK